MSLPTISKETKLNIDAAVPERRYLLKLLESGDFDDSFAEMIQQRLEFVESYILEQICSIYETIYEPLEFD